MDMDTRSFGGDWANETFAALNASDLVPPEKWSAYTNTDIHTQSAFTIPPALLTHGSVARYGQVTPPEEMSPAEPERSAREQSIPVQQLKNEALFPDHQIQALQDFQPNEPQQEQQQQQKQQKRKAHDEEPSSKRRRTSSRQSSASANHTATPTHAQPPSSTDSTNPQPPKRKRGRPKSTPQMIEAYTADGFPFQVSSARQSHLEKNRVAAHKCRQRKKEYIGGLEGRAREFATKNKALKENVALLREELLELKNEVLRHAGCGFWAVDEYLSRCAGDLLGMQAPPTAQQPRHQQQALSTQSPQIQSPTMHSMGMNSPGSTTMRPDDIHRKDSSGSLPSMDSMDSMDHGDFGGFDDLLEDMDEGDM